MPSDTTSPPEVRERTSPDRMEGFQAPPLGSPTAEPVKIALLSGGRDKPYALGLTAALSARGMQIEFVGGDEFCVPELLTNTKVRLLNLRGDQDSAPLIKKMTRVLAYYWRLVRYAATAEPRVFHILWNNKFEHFDRTLLLFYYKLLGKKLVFTAHNVNTRERDAKDSLLNRLSLRVHYRLVDHIFVHTARMKQQLTEMFGVPNEKATIIPFGINATVPNTSLTTDEAKARLKLGREERAILFFGNIAPYKGLEFLVTAFAKLAQECASYRLIIAGQPKGSDAYWLQIQNELTQMGLLNRVIQRIEYVPDEETEVYFKAADVLVLPYTHIFQSGVLFLSYSFGLPAIVADVGSLREEIVEGETGFAFHAKDAGHLAQVVVKYFQSQLYMELERSRQNISQYAHERYSWAEVAATTAQIYASLLRN